MVEEKINKKGTTGYINVKYDKEKYDIEYVETKNIVILRRKKDNKVLEIFSDKIGFIVQVDTDVTNFLVTDYSKYDDGMSSEISFNHYTVNDYEDSLHLKKSLDCYDCNLSTCRLTDKSYIVEQNGYSGCIYNLEEKSDRFSFIYDDKKVREYFKDDTLLVTKKVSPYGANYIDDTITYGINPETFEIVTPIWSDLQQRFINIYTEEQAQQVRNKLIKKGMYLLREPKKENLPEITILFEIEEHLKMISDILYELPQGVYSDSKYRGYKVNEKFVKKFTNKID